MGIAGAGCVSARCASRCILACAKVTQIARCCKRNKKKDIKPKPGLGVNGHGPRQTSRLILHKYATPVVLPYNGKHTVSTSKKAYRKPTEAIPFFKTTLFAFQYGPFCAPKRPFWETKTTHFATHCVSSGYEESHQTWIYSFRKRCRAGCRSGRAGIFILSARIFMHPPASRRNRQEEPASEHHKAGTDQGINKCERQNQHHNINI